MSANSRIGELQFTERGKSLCVSLSNGFQVFQLGEKLKRHIHRIFDSQQIGKAVTIHESNVIVCTGILGQRSFSDSTLCIFDEAIGRVVLEISCPETIKRVYMIPQMFALSTKSEVRLYTFDPPILHSQFRTCQNEHAPCDFIQTGEDFILGMTGRHPGLLRLIRGQRCDNQDRTITAHTRPISFIKFNANGTLVATCSSMGTVIKMFNTKSGECVGQFRRGTLAAEITSIAFSRENELLAISSSKGTVHIFSMLSTAGTDTPTRSEMKIQNPDLESSVLSFGERNKLYAACKSGKFYVLKCSIPDKTVTVERVESF